MLIDAISSGIQAALTRQRVSAVNIANQSSEGYRAYRVIQTESAPGAGPAVRIERTDAPTDMVRETVEQLDAGREVAFHAAILRRQDQVLGTLLDVLA